MTLWHKVRLLLSLRSLASAGEKELRMGWNWKITLRKAISTLLYNGVTAIIVALALLPDSAINAWLLSVDVPPSIVATLTPALMMGIRALNNWWTHRTPSLPPSPPSPTYFPPPRAT